jgi:hypothetical protein
MTVTAPPKPPLPHDPFEHDDPEALIEEARQRTRRRRRRYGALALAAGATAGLSFYFGFAGGGTSARPTDALASPPAAAPVAAYPGYFELWFHRSGFVDGCCGPFPTWRTAAELGISPDEDIHTRSEINGPDENRRATDLLERVLTSLIAGPTPADYELLDETARDLGYPDGFQAAGGTGVVWGPLLPPNTHLLAVTLSNGVATIDIASEPLYPVTEQGWDSEFDYLRGDRHGFKFAALVLTATQFPFVDGVLFKLDGQPVKAQIEPPDKFSWDRGVGYALVGRPVTRADYEFTRRGDSISRQGPGT